MLCSSSIHFQTGRQPKSQKNRLKRVCARYFQPDRDRDLRLKQGETKMKACVLTILSIFAMASVSFAQTETSTLLQKPAVNGSQIVFVYAGDLWTVPRDGRRAEASDLPSRRRPGQRVDERREARALRFGPQQLFRVPAPVHRRPGRGLSRRGPAADGRARRLFARRRLHRLRAADAVAARMEALSGRAAGRDLDRQALRFDNRKTPARKIERPLSDVDRR